MRTLPFAFGRSLGMGAVIALAALFMLAPLGGAQDATPGASPMADDAAETHPAHFHAGTCDELGEVVIPLTDVTVPSGEHSGAETAHAIKTSHTTVDAPLQDIIDGGHAINVHESAEAIDVYIACGDVGGVVTTDDDGRMELVIALNELNDSGHVGIAWLGADGDQTEVVVTLIEPESMGMDH